ncbi:hypothetical protein, partial [Streptomyces mirabilis]|uniref:hypothetical protein n=1 Tax=Streptomyces mirabilis TaxID=68239 RepID=UPI00380E82E6
GSLKNSHHRRSQGSSSFPEKLSTEVSRWIRAQRAASNTGRPVAADAVTCTADPSLFGLIEGLYAEKDQHLTSPWPLSSGTAEDSAYRHE